MEKNTEEVIFMPHRSVACGPVPDYSGLRLAVIAYALASLLGIPGVILLFSPEYATFLLEDLAAGGITDPSSLRTWRIINVGVSLIACIGPAVLAAGLTLTLRGKPVRGLGIISGTAQVLLYGTSVGGILALILFVYRFVFFLIGAVQSANGVVLIYSMLISEALMVAQAVFLFFLIRKFLNCSIDAAASIAYSRATGKLDSRAISVLPAGFLTGLCVLNVFLALNRLFTVTIVRSTLGSYYDLITATNPGLILEAACLLLGALGNFFLARVLRSYKRQTEQLLFQSRFSGKHSK